MFTTSFRPNVRTLSICAAAAVCLLGFGQNSHASDEIPRASSTSGVV
jgi:hypothetical protein